MSAARPWKRRVAILASGAGTNATALMEAAALGRLPRAHIVLVATNRPDAGAVAAAKKFGVESLVIDHTPFGNDRAAHERALVQAMLDRKIDIVVMAGYMRILVGPMTDAFPGCILNLHPSLLPSFPGTHAVRDALAWGTKVTGATVHLATLDLDAGPIIAQRAVAIEEGDTEDSLTARIQSAEHEILPIALRLLSEERLHVEGRRVQIVDPPPDPRHPLLIATTNRHKIIEIEAILSHIGLKFLSLEDFPGHTDVEETGSTYRENALLKARSWHRRTGLWTLADDSGIEVDALGGRPGVKSARYAATQQARIERLLDELSRTPSPDKRTARFRCAAALVGPGGAERITEGTCEGHIAAAPRGEGGFGYDPVFIPDGYGGRHLSEIGDAAKNTMSHRALALAGLAVDLERLAAG